MNTAENQHIEPSILDKTLAAGTILGAAIYGFLGNPNKPDELALAIAVPAVIRHVHRKIFSAYHANRNSEEPVETDTNNTDGTTHFSINIDRDLSVRSDTSTLVISGFVCGVFFSNCR